MFLRSSGKPGHDSIEVHKSRGQRKRYFGYPFSFGCIVIGCGGLSRFRAEKSTRAQRLWTMTWLAFGIVWGTFLKGDRDGIGAGDAFRFFLSRMAYCAPAIGG